MEDLGDLQIRRWDHQQNRYSALVSDPQKLGCKTCAFMGMFDDMLEAWVEQLDADFCLELISVGQGLCEDWGMSFEEMYKPPLLH